MLMYVNAGGYQLPEKKKHMSWKKLQPVAVKYKWLTDHFNHYSWIFVAPILHVTLAGLRPLTV